MWASAKLEVFFCTAPTTEERRDLSLRLLNEWQSFPWAEVHVLTPHALGCDGYNFQKMRRVAADSMAKNDIYVLTDDDMEPLEDTAKAMGLLVKSPLFGILSAFPKNAAIYSWTPGDYQPLESTDIMEHHSVGGLRVMRRGLLPSWPEQERRGYDAEHCEAIRKAGYRVGYMKALRSMHFGEGRSTLYPLALNCT